MIFVSVMMFSTQVPEGVYVRAVVEGTVAYDCGKIRVNDRVLEVSHVISTNLSYCTCNDLHCCKPGGYV